MKPYVNKNDESCVESIEFAGEGKNQLVFIHTKPRTEEPKITDWLAKCSHHLQEIQRTQVDGHEVIIARSDQSPEVLLQNLQSQGEKLVQEPDKKKVDPWFLRGLASNIGQPLQLFSGWLKKGKIDEATMMFAALNITANCTNMIFGGEKKEDTSRTHFLKREVNQDLDEHLKNGAKPFGLDEDRSGLRQNAEKESAATGLWNFMQKNSVRIGEIGLRYIGSLALVLPISNIRSAYKNYKGGATFGEAFHIKNLYNKADQATLAVGSAYLVGKTIAFGSKIPDPYSTQAHTMVDDIREKVLFPLSSMIETGAAGYLAYDRFFKRRLNWEKVKWAPQSWKQNGTRDFLGGIGGALFTAGLLIRVFAPFGKRQVNMDEIEAHITDTLVNTPKDQLPRLLADSAATVYEHTKDNKLTYGEIFTSMAADLQEYHHIDFSNTIPKDTMIAGTEHEQATKKYTDSVQKDNNAQTIMNQHDERLASHADKYQRAAAENMHLSV